MTRLDSARVTRVSGCFSVVSGPEPADLVCKVSPSLSSRSVASTCSKVRYAQQNERVFPRRPRQKVIHQTREIHKLQ